MQYYTATRLGDRTNNEDCTNCFSSPIGLCLILCDGLGGHGMGDAASSLVCQSFERSVMGSGERDPAQILTDGIQAAQNALLAKQRELGCNDGMLTTVCALIIIGDAAYYTHIGDSRIYFFNDGSEYERTIDHSVPQMMALGGEIKERNIRHHPDRNRVLRVMGTEWKSTPFEVKVHNFASGKNEAVLMCTDGLWEWVTEREMMRLKRRARSASQWLDDMMLAAKRNAGRKKMDNHTGIAVFTAFKD